MKKGFTLTEVMVAAAITGIMALVIAKMYVIFNNTSAEMANMQILRSETARIISDISLDIVTVGSDLDNVQSKALIVCESGRVDYDYIGFFYKDENGNGVADDPDTWLYYGVFNGRLERRKYKDIYFDSNNYPVDPKICTLKETTIVSSPLVKVEKLIFNMYTSKQTCTVSDAKAASSVRIFLELSIGNFKFNSSRKLLLTDIINGQT